MLAAMLMFYFCFHIVSTVEEGALLSYLVFDAL